MFEENRILHDAFLRELNSFHKKFDEKENMLIAHINKKGYHSVLDSNTVHIVRESMGYATALLYSGDPVYMRRAYAVIDKVLLLQDMDENSPTYGIWPYYLEEPLKQMKAPDWNWADFIGAMLIHLLIDHYSLLPGEMVQCVEKSLYHAAASIKRRNIGPDYTNINLMGAFVTIKAGELLKIDEFFDYGKKRLKKELEYVRANGGFSEYNSPTYTLIALEEIGRMLKYFNDNECLDIARELNDLEWRCIARHFHSPTMQLSAPHSRCYDNIAGKSLASFLHIGTGMKLNLLEDRELQVGLLWNHIVIQCPEKYFEYFEPISKPRIFKEKFYKGMDTISDDEIRVLIEKGTPDMEATTYMNKSFSLGTFAKYDLWNQRRPLMAYWGTSEECTYLKLRCMHDGQDYCSAMICTSQINNHVVGGVHFVKDHGDFHFILDPLDEGRIKARKLSLRFEIGGFIDDVVIPPDISIGSSFEIRTKRVDIRINPMFCAFDGETVRVEKGGDGSVYWVDIVLYEGEEKTIDFNNMKAAAFVFGLSIFDREICTHDGSSFQYSLDLMNESVKAELAGVAASVVEIPIKPSNYINEPVVEQVKKVKCGGFVYERE